MVKKAEEPKKKESRRALLNRIKQETLRRILFLEHKAVIDYRDVYHLIRWFFKEYLEKRYEFTITELRDEIHRTYIPSRVREQVILLLKDLEKMEYETIHYSKVDLVGILERFRKIVDEIIGSQRRRHSWMQKIKAFLLKEEENPIIISELPAIENSDAYHVNINILLERTYLFIDQKNKRKAKRQYQELHSVYEASPEDIKHEYYPLIDQTYETLVSSLGK